MQSNLYWIFSPQLLASTFSYYLIRNSRQIVIGMIMVVMDLGWLSLSDWVETLLSDDLLALMIGCSPDSFPPLGSYYDLIDRLWLRNPQYEKLGRKDLCSVIPL